jgi:hypothetical protein
MKLGLIAATVAIIAPTSMCGMAADAPPKEGRLEFNLCFAGTVQHTEVSPQLAVGSFDSLAAVHSIPPGGPFDLQGAHCIGTYTITAGKHWGTGYCIHVDPDGDKWLEKWEAGADFSGAWKAEGGSGKYTGLQASGSFKPVGFPAAALPNSVQNCNYNTGTYKLK